MIHTGYGRFVLRYVKYEELLKKAYLAHMSAQLPFHNIMINPLPQDTTSTSRFFGTSTHHTLPLPPDTSSGPKRYRNDPLTAFTEFASIAQDLNQVVQTLLLGNYSFDTLEVILPLEAMGRELDYHATKMTTWDGLFDPQFNGDMGGYLHGPEAPGQRFVAVNYPNLVERFCEKWVRVLDVISGTIHRDYEVHYRRKGGLWNPGSFTDQPEVTDSIVEKILYHIAPPSHYSPLEILFQNLELWLQDLVDDAIIIQNETKQLSDHLQGVSEGLIAATADLPNNMEIQNGLSLFDNPQLHPGALLSHQMQISFSDALSISRRVSKKLSNVRSMVEAIRGSNPGNGAGPYRIPTREQLVVAAQAAATVMGQLRERLGLEWLAWKVLTHSKRLAVYWVLTCRESTKLPVCQMR